MPTMSELLYFISIIYYYGLTLSFTSKRIEYSLIIILKNIALDCYKRRYKFFLESKFRISLCKCCKLLFVLTIHFKNVENRFAKPLFEYDNTIIIE